MEKKKRFKKCYVLLMIIIIVFGPKLYRVINYEVSKDYLLLNGSNKNKDVDDVLTKIKYDNLDDLASYLDEKFYWPESTDSVNNVVYTLSDV